MIFFHSSLSFSINNVTVFNTIYPWINEALILSTNVVIGKGFTGLLTDLNMWSRPLTSSELGQFVNCNTSFGSEFQIVNWSNKNITFDPNVIVLKHLLLEEACYDESWKKLFPHKISFLAALKLCQDLDGKMFLPPNRDGTIASEGRATSCEGRIWLPVVRSRNNSWVMKTNVDEQEDSDQVLDLGTVANLEAADKCVIWSDSGFEVENCEAEHCFVCDLNQSPVFKFRGHCASSNLFDPGYVLDPDEDIFYFRGFSGIRQFVGNLGGFCCCWLDWS